MKQKVVQKETKAEVNGSAKFDENGKMMLPILENGKMEMKSTEELKKILDKKDHKAKVKKTPISNNKQKQVVKERKIADASYRTKFVDCVVAKIPNITVVEKDDRVILKFGSNALCRLMVRSGHRFTCYKKDDEGKRATQKITNDEDEEALLKWIQNRIELLKSNQK